jgi:ornithine cyclodeaminase/alanine dehydrogenase-like protein (mu-crystallin family)
MRLIAAALPEFGVVGYKEFHFVGNEVRFQINLFDIDSGVPLACLDGNYLTVLRTAATAALAAARLAPRASVVGIIGSGHEARMQATVISRLLTLDRMSVYSPRAERRELMARDLSTQLDIPVHAAAEGAAAVADADLIMVATNTAGAGPAFFADWIPPTAAHISSTGSTLPEERELDAGVWAYPDLIVVDRMQVLDESGDAREAARAGTLDPGRVITLAELCGRPAPPGGVADRRYRYAFYAVVSRGRAAARAASVSAVARSASSPTTSIATTGAASASTG